jgi:DNA-binding transcriptional regulator YhcF (GntR family)
MDERAGVYAIRCVPTGQVYVGSSKDVSWRKVVHWARLRNGTHYNLRLQEAWTRHGEEAFVFEVLELLDDPDTARLREAEALHILAFRSDEGSQGFNGQVPSSPRTDGAPSLIQLDEAGATPKYQQIADQVRALVAAGALRPGDLLPSVRQIASDLGINVNTVLTAYRVLEAENIVLIRRGARAVVHPRLALPAEPRPADLRRIRAALERTRTDAVLAGIPPERLRALAAEVFAE